MSLDIKAASFVILVGGGLAALAGASPAIIDSFKPSTVTGRPVYVRPDCDSKNRKAVELLIKDEEGNLINATAYNASTDACRQVAALFSAELTFGGQVKLNGQYHGDEFMIGSIEPERYKWNP